MKSIDEFRTALEHARAATAGYAGHVETDPVARVASGESWWDVPVSEVAELKSTQQARKAHEVHKAAQLPLIAPVSGEDAR